jgi:hypothetical protein
MDNKELGKITKNIFTDGLLDILCDFS